MTIIYKPDNCVQCEACIENCIGKAFFWENEEIVFDPNGCLECPMCQLPELCEGGAIDL